MFSGRLIYGSGAEVMDVAQCAILAQWFKGQELAFAFGLSYLSMFVESLTGLTQAFLDLKYEGEPVKAVSWGLFIGFAFCCFSLLCALALIALDSYADRVDRRQAALTDEDRFHIRDVKYLPKPLWLICVIAFFWDSVVYTFISNIMQPMMVYKYGYSEA